MRETIFCFLLIILTACGSGSSSGDGDSNGGGGDKPVEPLSESELVINVNKNNIQIYAKGADRHSDRYLEYNLKHIDDPLINANLWRLYELYESKNVSNLPPYSFFRVHDKKPIVNAGEWELAIREAGADDFMGGYHGDELLTSVSLVINGENVPIRESQYVADSLSFTQTSDLYSWYTGQVVAKHIKEYKFSQAGIILKQKVEWERSVEVSRAYLSMFPVKRKIDYTSGTQITDTAWYWPSGDIQDVSESGFALNVKTSDDEIWLEGAESRFRAEVKMTEHPRLPGYNVFVHNVDAYNKIYFDISNRYTTKIGEIWETETIYKLTTYN
ncbi:hypothetical protein [Vibrio antiquarius]|uniref:hypothetical protein n=1 Tax=Vibrio antiquarius (strain Ex25) TaxID=150340 RepID=UPI002657B4BE|nr:hypothetical protein [Vibrio antiquarius]MCR9549029.1 hypothetical protein [Vibrio antiquarius]